MESPVVLDKPPEYHGSDRGFPFDDEEASGAWSELAARHPDIAARLRQRPASATWARKRRPSSQDATDDFGENFSGFDRFPFDDIPPEFREHFPSHWNRRFGSREEAPPQPPPHASPPPPAPQQHTATQTDAPAPSEPSAEQTQTHSQSLPQYGLRNTVDLGQKSPADPSLVDAEERAPRCMSAPPEPRPPRDMSAPPPESGHVRHIPIFVEGRDEPVLSRAEPPHPAHAPHPAPHVPHIDRDAYFADDTPSFHHPPNFSRAFGTPSGKPFRPGPQPFMQQKAYPQTAFTRAPSPQRDRSPRPPQPPQPAAEEPFVKVPVQHQHTAPHPPPPPQQSAAPQREATPPHVPPKPTVNDPITQILGIQTDVLNLMTEVENFTGTKKDKRYLFLDEMLTRNLIKLDNIETEGKENIRLARKEAIRCIQKCIAVLEAKAEMNGNPPAPAAPAAPAEVDMNEPPKSTEDAPAVNGEVEMKMEPTEPQTTQPGTQTAEEAKPPTEPQPQDPAPDAMPSDAQPQETKPSEEKQEEKTKDIEDKPSPKKKVVKKRDKSKDKAAESTEAKDSNKVESVEVMQVDNKGDKTEQVMEVDGAASQ